MPSPCTSPRRSLIMVTHSSRGAGAILSLHTQEKSRMRTTGSEFTVIFTITFQKWSTASIKEIQLFSRITFLSHKNILTSLTPFSDDEFIQI